jgi:hypothetical protein
MNRLCTFRKGWVPLLVLVWLLCWGGQASAQAPTTYGNEWINYDQTYYKIQVAQNGIYRLSHTYLTQAGISGVDPRKFQLFRRGQEVAIHVAGEADGVFDPTDFIEFYGERNDGKLDVELYKDPAHQVHQYYSLYTDTAAYFLTWGTANGKRMGELNMSRAGLVPEPRIFVSQLDVRATGFIYGRFFGDSRVPWMDLGEGFHINTNAPTNYTFSNLTNLETTGAKPVVEAVFAGSLPGPHEIDAAVVLPSGALRQIRNLQYQNYEHHKLKLEIEFSDISADGRLNLRFTNKGDWYSLRYIKITYPQTPNLVNRRLLFSFDSTKTSPTYLLLENAPPNSIAYDVTNPYAVDRTPGFQEGNRKVFVLSASNGRERRAMVEGAETQLTPLPAVKVVFRRIQPSDHDYIIISHKKLTAPAGSSSNPVRDYAAYRASAIGGGHDTLVVMVDQLYDQFHYGERSSSGIRRFMHFLLKHGKPQYLLLLGKGFELQYRLGHFRSRPFTATEQDLVPTGGNPASDIFFTADWQNDSFEPRVATGRVAAFTSAAVLSYLEKVKLHEALGAEQEWRKNILHLGGGQTEQEIRLFKQYLQTYRNKAESPFFGGKVTSIGRNSTRDIVTNINVSKEVNQGLSLITFFGHSSATISDIDIGNVSNTINGYRNVGRYPMILMNGCNSGNAFSRYSFGEDWILTPEKGAILFIAHAHLGYPNLLNLYTSNFYQTAFNSSIYYGKPVGEIQQEVSRQVNAITKGVSANTMIMQMVLQGDPAVALFAPAKPDYEITDQSLSLRSFDGNPVTVTSEKFVLAVDIKNLGKATLDSFYVSVKQTLPDNQEIMVDSLLFPPVYYRDTLLITLQSPGAGALGINKFEVFVDHTNKIDELNEENNKGQLEFFIGQTGITALFPLEYSILNRPAVKLTAMGAEPLAENVEYYYEIDTTHVFKKPLLSTVIKAGNLPVWEVNLANIGAKDSLVYFWRVRSNSIEPGTDTVWAQSSFRYISTSSPGWSQSHYGQFSKALLKDLRQEPESRTWEFNDIKKNVEIRGAGGNIGFSYPPYGIFINGQAFFNNSCGYGRPNMLISVFHPRTLEPFNQMPPNTGTVCGVEPRSFYHFVDLGVAGNQAKLEAFLQAIPQGYYVALLSMNRVPFSNFSAELKSAFATVGSSLIQTLETGEPFALVGRKGDAPGTAQEVTSNPDDPTPPASQAITLFSEITGKGSGGSISSSRIGPAKEWTNLFHQVAKESADGYTLKVIGIGQEGNEKVLYEDVKASSFDLRNINAEVYPFLQLQMIKADDKDRTAPQLKQWVVTYQGLPEGVIRPDIFGKNRYDLSDKPVRSTITFPFVFQNISDKDFKEPITVEVSLFKANGSQSVENILLRPLAAGDTLRFDYRFSADGLVGENRMRVYFNPRLLPEQNYLNNIFEFSFRVREDELHPVLDVVFDGLHIMDGDIVSPSPVISMTLKDENVDRFIEDPSLMEIFLKRPGSADFEVIDVTTHAADIQYAPGDDKNPFRMDYNPKKLVDGLYELRVQGKDVAGNLSGLEMYRINFEVINESTITRFYPYPNPFSTNTRFIFTLTGSNVPENLKIQVMTVTGKVIREITRDEIGPIRIGNNITQFAWDGTDEFGDRLANGVYLYRVVMDRNQDEFKHRRTAGDKAFKQEFGKLYILR